LALAPWEAGASRRIMLPMTSPSRFLLIPAKRPESPGVKRYRLAKLKLEGRDATERFAHLKRVYD
jgi:hypothetical protein